MSSPPAQPSPPDLPSLPALPCPPVQPTCLTQPTYPAHLSNPAQPEALQFAYSRENCHYLTLLNLASHWNLFCWNPSLTPPSSKETTGSHWKQHIASGQRSPALWWWWWGGSLETPHLRGASSSPPFPGAEAPSPSPWDPPGVCRGVDWPRLRSGPTRFQEEPLAGRRQQGSGALVAG